MALIVLSAGLTAAKIGDIRQRGRMFGVLTACRCCKRFPFTFNIYTAMMFQGKLTGLQEKHGDRCLVFGPVSLLSRYGS